jgi:hypothetical protein
MNVFVCLCTSSVDTETSSTDGEKRSDEGGASGERARRGGNEVCLSADSSPKVSVPFFPPSDVSAFALVAIYYSISILSGLPGTPEYYSSLLRLPRCSAHKSW